MTMKITPQILSLPPYISTTWANIASLRVEHVANGSPVLIIELLQGDQVEIPGLDLAVIDTIFAAHAHALESQGQALQTPAKQDPLTFAFNLPLKLFGEGFTKMGAVLQHNPEAAETSDIPQEVIEKISSFIQTLGLSETTAIPMPVQDCNCTFCQVSRAIHVAIEPMQQDASSASLIEDPISDEDLRFRTWDIVQKGDRLYLVTNPIDESEQYNVYLGEPIGCTCGHRNCEHILAVLSS